MLIKKMMTIWETNPPVLSAPEVVGDLAAFFPWLQKQTILLPTTPAAAFTCTECGERPRLTYLTDRQGKTHAYMNCRECGPARVDETQLLRWEINTSRFLSMIFRSIKLAVDVQVPGNLWQVGKATWAGRVREIWFVRTFERSIVTAVVEALKSHPRAIVFTPTEARVRQWQALLTNQLIALKSMISLVGTELVLDTELIQGCLVDVSATAPKPIKRRHKRADRAVNIEKLAAIMADHLLAAKEHAWHTKAMTGTPELLPRPQQNELAALVGLSEPVVSRCVNDETAKELHLYWTVAEDLDQVMRWPGPKSKKRRRRRKRSDSK